jgi:type I restriction enzyme S subunit
MSKMADSGFRPLEDLVAPVDAKITLRKDPAKPYVGLENLPSRGAHLLGWESATSSVSANSVFRAGDVLFGKLRPNLRKCVIAPFDGYCSTDILVLRSNDGIDGGFAGKVLRTEHIWAAAERTSAGTKMPRTSWKQLSALHVFCPAQSEQALISQILDTLDAATHETEAIIAKLMTVKQGLLHDLLTRGIDANGELRAPQAEAPQIYVESSLGWIPKEWEIQRLDSVAVRGSGHTPSKNVPSYWNGGIKWVSLADSHRLDKIHIHETDKQISELGIANSSAVLHSEGSVVLSRDAGVGKSAILGCDMAVSQHFMAWHCSEKLNNLFLYFYLQREKPKFESIAMGSTIKTIGLPFFKSYEIVVPPRCEQDQASAILMAAEESLAMHVSELRKLGHQKAGLMDDLLTGRVRVTPLLAQTKQPETEGIA